jgi:formate/nitrite transporter FocA (FNT family)
MAHKQAQALVPIGMFYGADASVATFIVNNVLPCVAGNILGGGLLIGGTHT